MNLLRVWRVLAPALLIIGAGCSSGPEGPYVGVFRPLGKNEELPADVGGALLAVHTPFEGKAGNRWVIHMTRSDAKRIAVTNCDLYQIRNGALWWYAPLFTHPVSPWDTGPNGYALAAIPPGDYQIDTFACGVSGTGTQLDFAMKSVGRISVQAGRISSIGNFTVFPIEISKFRFEYSNGETDQARAVSDLKSQFHGIHYQSFQVIGPTR